jgi:dTDP-4-dehydrorhamnose 3,5-epimerase
VRFVPTALPEVVVVEPEVRRDERGWLVEAWSARAFREAGIDAAFVQENVVVSGRAVLRGLHAQRRKPQGKLVRCVEGEVFDVAVDVRTSSPTYRRWVGTALSGENARAVWIPPGFAHGYCVVGERAVVSYSLTAPFDPSDEVRIAWDDPAIGVRWPVTSPTLSPADRAAPPLGR